MCLHWIEVDSFGVERELALMQRSRKDVEKAGRLLRANPELSEKPSETLLILSEWRAVHELALKKVMTALRVHVNSHGWDALITGRMKRIRSIVSKLQREPTMSLTQMQDIGGCRAVMENVELAELLAEKVRSVLHERLSAGGQIREKNYIKSPKPDGYRSIHFVVQYLPSKPEDMKPRRIEIQVRSLLQHRWATALETVDLFTGQTLKTGGGDLRWRRFFALASAAFAHQERRAIVPGTSAFLASTLLEMRALAKELRVVSRLQHWSQIMRDILEDTARKDRSDRYCYLIELDVQRHETHIKSYSPDELKLAHKEYLGSEERNAKFPHRSTVLVTAYSLDEARKAYPGFYGDTKAFLREAKLI